MDLSVVWLIAGLVLMVLEFVVPGFVIIFFGVGGLITGTAVWLFPAMEASFTAQGLCFALTSVLALVVGRRCFRNLLGGKAEPSRGDADDDGFVGSAVVVSEAIRPPLPGRVTLNGAGWPAVSDRPIEVGATVTVVARDNLTLTVR